MYVTKDDYLKTRGINLDIELKKNDYDTDNYVEIFINKVEKQCLNFLKRYTFRTVPFEECDQELLKEGIMCQIDYVLRNGDMANDNQNNQFYISPLALDCFFLAGVANSTPNN